MTGDQDAPDELVGVAGTDSPGRRPGRRRTGAYVVLGVAVAAVLGVWWLLPEPSRSAPVPDPHASRGAASAAPSAPSVPSQSAADARRDGVVPAVAALPLAHRMSVIDQAAAPEGMWLATRVPSSGWGPGGTIGDTSGTYGQDFVSGFEYAELLLLDQTMSRILRAYPMPAVPPDTLLVQPEAVYCAQQGDGALPDSMLCRVDRRSFELTVRVFPHESSTEAQAPRPGWTWDRPGAGALFEELSRCGARLCVSGSEGQRQVDPITLELLP